MKRDDERFEARAMNDPATRTLVFRFWKLASSHRRSIAEKLDLLDEGDWKLEEPDRYSRALLRAARRGLLDAVATEVARWEGSLS